MSRRKLNTLDLSVLDQNDYDFGLKVFTGL